MAITIINAIRTRFLEKNSVPTVVFLTAVEHETLENIKKILEPQYHSRKTQAPKISFSKFSFDLRITSVLVGNYYSRWRHTFDIDIHFLEKRFLSANTIEFFMLKLQEQKLNASRDILEKYLTELTTLANLAFPKPTGGYRTQEKTRGNLSRAVCFLNCDLNFLMEQDTKTVHELGTFVSRRLQSRSCYLLKRQQVQHFLHSHSSSVIMQWQMHLVISPNR